MEGGEAGEGSAISVPGAPVSLSAAYSGRIAGAAFHRKAEAYSEASYECESSQWVLEVRILLRNVEVCILILLVLLISVDLLLIHLIFLISLPDTLHCLPYCLCNPGLFRCKLKFISEDLYGKFYKKLTNNSPLFASITFHKPTNTI